MKLHTALALLCFGLMQAATVAAEVASATLPVSQASAPAIPDSFADPKSGLRILHLSNFPNERSGVVYFHQNSFTKDGRYALIDEQFQDKWRHIYVYDFKTQKVKPLVTDVLTHYQIVSRKTHDIYYYAAGAAWSVDIDTAKRHKIADVPESWANSDGFALNADETVLAASAPAADVPGIAIERIPNGTGTAMIFTVDIATGRLKEVWRESATLDHLQFSPTDPTLLMFAHEGTWAKVDRIWTLKLGASAPVLMYKRTVPGEMVGHEFWSPDGKWIWFQHGNRTTGESSYVGAINVATGESRRLAGGNDWSGIHETWSPDGTFMVADGDAKQKGIYLLELDGDNVKATQLVDTSANDYKLAEPNPHISPDNRWVTFTATLTSGPPQAFAVELPQRLWKRQ
jgi:oligogalacturonide lyase